MADELGRSRLELAGQGVRYSMALRSYSKIKVYVAGTWNDMLDMAIAAFLQSIPYIKEHPNMGELMKEWIEQIPGGQPKTGQWIYKERNILINTGRVSYGENGAVQEKRWAKVKKPYCSECGWYENSEYEATPYCPNCGARMKSEGEKGYKTVH